MSDTTRSAGLGTIVVEWGRIGVTGFGGPPVHIAMFRRLCVERRGWITDEEFEDSIAACNMLPGPASTQLAIHSAHRIGGIAGAVIGGLAFILPGFAAIVLLSALFFASSPPGIVLATGAGAASAVAAVAVSAGVGLAQSSWTRATVRWRWSLYVVLGLVTAAVAGTYVVVVLLACGCAELIVVRGGAVSPAVMLFNTSGVVATGGILGLSWLAFKVGALSYGGGFVIIPLMQNDAVSVYQWMTDAQFLNVVALGQVTPGPVVLTVAAVGYAAFGIGGAALATVIAFGPSFVFVIGGARRFDSLRSNRNVRAFLDGAGPTATGAILGAAIPLAAALDHDWQYAVCAAALVWAVIWRKGVVSTLVGAASIGVVVFVVGGPIT